MKFCTNHLDIFNNNSISSFNANQISSQLHQFTNIMESLALSNEEDKMQWILITNNTFPVKSCYVSLNDGRLRSQFRNNIWKSSVPLKIKVFAQLVTHDKILFRDNLARKWWIGPLHYVFCGHDLEIIAYIFLHCPMSLAVWDFFLHYSNCINNISNCDIFSVSNFGKFNLSMHGWYMLLLAPCQTLVNLI